MVMMYGAVFVGRTLKSDRGEGSLVETADEVS